MLSGTPSGLFSSLLVYFWKLELFSVTKVAFLFQSPRSRRALLLLQRSQLGLCSPDFGAFCCSSDTTEGRSRCTWGADSDVEHRSEGWQGRLGAAQCEEYLTLQMGAHKGSPGTVKCRGGAGRGGHSLEQMPVAGLEEAGHRVLRMPRALVEAQSTTGGCKTTPRVFGVCVTGLGMRSPCESLQAEVTHCCLQETSSAGRQWCRVVCALLQT